MLLLMGVPWHAAHNSHGRCREGEGRGLCGVDRIGFDLI